MSSSNVSAVSNYFATANEGFTTTLDGNITSGAATVPLIGVSGLTDGTVFVGIIEPGQTNQQVFTGTVDVSGSRITGVKWTRGTNVGHTGGVTIVDYVSGTAFNMMSTGILKEHNQNGTHAALTSTNATLTTPVITSPLTKGLVDGWIGANESWTFASSTTITVPTDATTKYDVGDYIKFSQSSTVKYFVVTGVTSTVLTLVGHSGATVANSGISANYYSKPAPHGASGAGVPLSATVLTSEATSSGTYGDLATAGPAVSVVVGGSGAVQVSISCFSSNSLASGDGTLMGFAVSGANTLAAGTAPYIQQYQTWANGAQHESGTTWVIVGLAPGVTVFTAKYAIFSGGTATFKNRNISVVPL